MFMLGAADDGRMEKAFSAGSATYSAYLRQNAVKSVLSSAASAGPSKATRKYSGAGSGSFPPPRCRNRMPHRILRRGALRRVRIFSWY